MQQNKWVALGVWVALSSAAQAQSNVNVYGLADLAVEHLRHVGAEGRSLTRMPGLTGSAASRLGFRGSEDLGGGLKTVFTLEAGFGMDSGGFNQGGRTFGRQAWVGLEGRWGALTLGRQYSMLYWSQLEADILGANLYSSASLDHYLPNARADNALAYRGTFHGVTVGLAYSLGRDTVNGGPSPAGTNCAGEDASDKKACRQWSAMLKYDAPHWGASLAVDSLRGGPGAYAGLIRSSMTDRRTSLNVWTKLGRTKLGAGVIARDNAASSTPRSKLWYAGAAYHLTPAWVLDGEVFMLDYQHSRNDAVLYAVRATHQLSKRTALYATVGRITNKGTSALSVSGAAAGGAPAPGAGQTALAVGMRHAF